MLLEPEKSGGDPSPSSGPSTGSGDLDTSLFPKSTPSKWIRPFVPGALALGLLSTMLPDDTEADVHNRSPTPTKPEINRFERFLITSYNVGGLPDWEPGLPKDRLRAIGDWIAKNKSDVVCLQEVWQDGAKSRLFSEKDWNSAQPNNDWRLFSKNGLVTLTKHPIIKGENLHFSVESRIDSLASKGALYTLVQLPDGSKLAVWNVHLQSRGGDENIRVRKEQIKELGEWIKARSGEFDRFIVTGDFNCEPDSAEYADLTAKVGSDLRNSLPPDERAASFVTSTMNDWKSPKQEVLLDHILIGAAGWGEMSEVKISVNQAELKKDGKCLSDHYPITAEIRLGRRAGGLQ